MKKDPASYQKLIISGTGQNGFFLMVGYIQLSLKNNNK